MNDHLLVEALRERDPSAPAAVYDAHARRLYAYCWFQLRCRDTAQVALRDTFIVAEAHIGKLRDPHRFRAWLYAIARLECARHMPLRNKTPDMPVASHDQEDVDQRITAWQAVLALRPVSREILELSVRHRLPVPDLAAVLGLLLKDALEALDLARAELEDALVAEMLVQQGPYGCARRALLLRERCGELDHELSGRLRRHAEACSVCGSLRPRSVSARKVYGLLPDARPAAELRLRVMSCFLDPELVGYRLFVATRVTEFASDGFPVQDLRSGRASRQGGDGSWLGRFRKAPTAAHEAGIGAQAVRAAVVLAVVALLSGGGVASMYGVLGTSGSPAETAAGPQPTVVPGISQTPETRRPAMNPDESGPLDAAPVSATFPFGARASSAPPMAVPEPPPVPVSGTEPTTPAGVLVVSPLYLDLAGGSDGAIDVRAEDGPVTWVASTQGPVRIQPSSGRLQPGQAVTLHVHVSRGPDDRGAGTVTFRPGAVQVHVTWRKDAPPAPGPSPTPTGSSSPSPSAPPATQRPGSPHPTPTDTDRPGSGQPTPTPSTPAPTSPPGSAPETTPSPTGRPSDENPPSVGPTATA
ncbi:sigma-70 family RNA polymerase sigma factor [Actinomadura sp. NAK00032]|uniref:sigma factor n=1 Tax=Actinomadura sp. NAK00032 TaxID=2742128 RepID=UPI0015905974|nr:sigma factor [Actinomadura sp. NAK00032]QKW39530.1 sigma-70 family RNA polymerase sigma factor [Actinomadura sp. NAK00032]